MPESQLRLEHVGILCNRPPGEARLPFIQSSNDIDYFLRPMSSRLRGICFASESIGRAVARRQVNVYYFACGSLVPGALEWIEVHRHVEVTMKTQGEIEAAICTGITDFEREFMGRGPKDIQAHLLGDLLVVRLKGVLTAAEKHLVTMLPAEKGRDLLKQVRTHLIEAARTMLEAMVFSVTDVKVITLHHDISTQTGEEIVVFTLAESPLFRETKKR